MALLGWRPATTPTPRSWTGSPAGCARSWASWTSTCGRCRRRHPAGAKAADPVTMGSLWWRSARRVACSRAWSRRCASGWAARRASTDQGDDRRRHGGAGTRDDSRAAAADRGLRPAARSGSRVGADRAPPAGPGVGPAGRTESAFLACADVRCTRFPPFVGHSRPRSPFAVPPRPGAGLGFTRSKSKPKREKTVRRACYTRRGRRRRDGVRARGRAGRDRRTRDHRPAGDDRLGAVYRSHARRRRCRMRVPERAARLLEAARRADPARRRPRQAQGPGRAVPGRHADQPRRARRLRPAAGHPRPARAQPRR